MNPQRLGDRLVNAGVRLGLTGSGTALLGLVVAGWIAARMAGGPTAFLLVYGMVIVLALSWFLGRRRPAVEAVRSELPVRVRAGQLVGVELNLTGRRGFSNFIIEEKLPAALGRPFKAAVPTLGRGRSLSHRYSFVPRHRGVHKVGPLVATWGDPFGLTKRQTEIAGAAELIVHPALEPVSDRVVARQWEDPPVRPPVHKPWPTGFEFYGMRDYVPGDDPRRIVWRASARTIDPVTGAGRYLVRESEQGITDRVVLVLDTDLAGHEKGEPSPTFETAVSLVASLAVRHLRDGFTVTVETNGHRLSHRIRGPRQRIRILDQLARVEMEKLPFTQAMDRLQSEREGGRHIVVVTPSLNDETAGRLRLQIKKGASVIAAIVTGEDLDRSSAERAAAMGCSVVEIRAGMPLEAGFRRMVGAGAWAPQRSRRT